jgi:hypothetical protein
LAGIVHYPPDRRRISTSTADGLLFTNVVRCCVPARSAYVSELIFVVACALLGCVYAAVVYCFVNDYELRHDN